MKDREETHKDVLKKVVEMPELAEARAELEGGSLIDIIRLTLAEKKVKAYDDGFNDGKQYLKEIWEEIFSKP